TMVNQPSLEGWTAVGASSFTVWADGDTKTAPDGTTSTLYKDSYPSENFVELSGGSGLERTVNTVAGMQYTLVYDFASELQDNTGSLTLYVDGQAISACHPTSGSDTDLSWHEGQITFVGSGGPQTLRLVSGSAGVMLGDLSLSQEPVNTGYQNTAIRLQQVTANLADTGGSEALSDSMENVPVGATLTDGTSSFTATAGQTSVDITSWNWANLSITPPGGFYGTIALTVRATSSVASNGASASTTQSLPVTVLAIPVAQTATVTTPENTPYVFQWSDFNVSDPQTAELSLDIDTWAQGGGYLEYLTSAGWERQNNGLAVTKADIDAGKLRFVPWLNETGYSGYGGTGLGDRQATYTLFNYRAFDGGMESAPAAMNIDVTPVVTPPALSVSGQAPSVDLDVVLTNWQEVANPDSGATQISGPTLDGWTAVGASGFTVWSGHDVTTASDGTSYTFDRPWGPGNNFLELAGSTGIEQTVNTVAGVRYSLFYDFASELGDNSGSFTVYVDGQPLPICNPPTSNSSTGLDWEEGRVNFIGTGGPQTIRLVTGTQGAMLAKVTLTQEPANTGYQDTAIRLQEVDANLVDNGGSEALSVSMEDIPVGAVLTDGTNSFTATAGQTSADITSWNWANLSITPPSGFYGTIALTVRATSTVPSNGATASVTQGIPVTVLSLPVAQSSTVSTNENTPYVFQWSDFNVSDAQTTALSLDLGSWCQGGGYLQYLTSAGWETVINGLLVTKADLDAGKLRFVPWENETGYAGYGGTGLGNLQGTYTLFTYRASDGGTESAQVSMNIDVVPVATAPILTIGNQITNVSLAVVDTTWGSVANPDSGATQVSGSTLEGWTAVGASGFTVWTDGDTETASDGNSYTINSHSDPGSNFLDLAGGTGIERTVNTVAGMHYTLSYDFASHLLDSTGSVSVYVDGQLVQPDCAAPTSQSGTCLDWQGGGVEFTGTGGPQTIQLV